VAVVYGFAAHATVVVPPPAGSPAPGYDGDYPGVASATIEGGLTAPPPARGPPVALYLPGAGGDINVAPRGGVADAVAAGQTLAAAVAAAIAVTGGGAAAAPADGHGSGNASGHVADGRPLPAVGGAAWAAVPLPFRATVPAATLRRRARRGSVDGAGAAAAVAALPPGAAASAAAYPLGVGVWSVGGVRLALLGGEPTVGYAGLLAGGPAPPVHWVVGYVDDVVGYVGDPAVLAGGGREGSLRAATYYGLPERWATEAPAVLVAAVTRMAAAVGGGARRPVAGAQR